METVAPARPRGRPRKTIDERDDGNRRLELVRTSAKLFRKKGFDATSTRDIAAAVGMRSGSPFYHFKNKGALLHAVMEEGMRSAIEQQRQALQKAEQTAADPQGLMAVLIRNHLGVLLDPGSDFIPVMLYEWRSLNALQRASIKQLKDGYEAVWMPVLKALRSSGQLRADVHLARLMIFGALNWAPQWFDPQKPATLDDLTEAAVALFISH